MDIAALSLSLHECSEKPQSDLMKLLDTSPNGLHEVEVSNRLRDYGYNTFRQEKNLHIVLEYLSTFRNPVMIILIIVSLVSFGLQETLNAVIILIMVLLSATLNFFQEYKANRSAKKLKDKVAAKTTVIRDGRKQEIPSIHICIGDILDLNAGDLIPADARLLEANNFFVNQSMLTGESFPIGKKIDGTVNQKENDIDLPNMIFAGTSVVTGTARALVLKTGSRSQFGTIANDLSNAPEENDFTKGIQSFSYLILKVIMFLVLFIFLINSLLKHDVLESFTFAIAVAVGLAPEFLPMIMSVTMGKGSVKMAKKGVIVKKLTAIPAFGSMDILCTDKTGTLTEANIKLVKYVDIFGHHSDHSLLLAYINSSFQTGIANPMDDAVLSYKDIDISKYKKIHEIPYDFSRKRMSVVVSSEKTHTLITKGAPEEIFSCCRQYRHGPSLRLLTPEIKKEFHSVYNSLSRDGFRVLAIATKRMKENDKSFTKDDEFDMELVGFVAFLDPAKLDAKESIDELEAMGIEMKIVTGDNELVTEKIARDVGIKIKGMLLGSAIRDMSDVALQRKVETVTIFARCSPQEKKRVIEALKKNNHVVGYMGDGINDASSLQIADVGISVNNAVDVAKETADIILTNKSLRELKDGVIEGRKTFGNTMKYILMGLSSNFGNMFSVLGAVIFLPFLPMLPIQILLNNFLYDFSQLTIPTDHVDRAYIEKPKRWDIKFIRHFMFIFGPISSLFDFTSFGLLYLLYRNNPAGFQTGWFMESLATQTLVIHVIRTRFTPISQSNASRYLWASTLISVGIGWCIPYTPIGTFFGLTGLPIQTVIMLGLIVIIYLLTAEIGKRMFYRKYDTMNTTTHPFHHAIMR
jgi:P-type Mg2+ transporter